MEEDRRRLLSVLARSQELGFLGPGPLEAHVERSLDFLALIPADAGRILDLGSGGGLPGLPLALARPDVDWVLLDGSVTRGRFLVEAVGVLQLSRTTVVTMRAEEAGRTEMRGWFDVVVSRSFGRPAVTAECAAPLLRPGGLLLVAEPPAGSSAGERWPAEGLAQLSMVPGDLVASPTALQPIAQETACPDRFPRRTGVPAKRPLF